MLCVLGMTAPPIWAQAPERVDAQRRQLGEQEAAVPAGEAPDPQPQRSTNGGSQEPADEPQQAGAASNTNPIAPDVGQLVAAAEAAVAEAATEAEAGAQITPESDVALGFTFTGDFRLRYEQTTRQAPGGQSR